MSDTPKLAPIQPAKFSNNPYIKNMGKNPKWTVSTKDKKPMNAKELLTDGANAGLYKSDNELVTLPELDADPNLTYVNRAYRLATQFDHLVLIDCEPTASQDVVTALAKLPVAYAEHSMHGGYHMLLPVPPSIIDANNEYLFDMTAVKGPKKMFELLLNRHFVTFTKRVLDTPQYDYRDPDVVNSIRFFFADLVKFDAKNQAQRLAAANNQIGKLDADYKLSPEQNQLLEDLEPKIDYIRGLKSPADYDNDMSRYEFAIAEKCLFYASNIQLKLINQNPFFGNTNPIEKITNEQCIQLAYALIKEVLPFREKHKTTRDGLPWLLYITKKVAEVNNTIQAGLKYGLKKH